MAEDHRIKILYLCTGNTCRSQMAEGLTRELRSQEFQAFSAGVDPRGVDPRAIRAMAEIGIDISEQESKNVDALGDQTFDYVVTLCDNARDNCPVLFGPHKQVHRGFPDPPVLAREAADEEEAMNHYRQVRDKIKHFVMALPGSLED